MVHAVFLYELLSSHVLRTSGVGLTPDTAFNCHGVVPTNKRTVTHMHKHIVVQVCSKHNATGR
jgi:hypothetical protein